MKLFIEFGEFKLPFVAKYYFNSSLEQALQEEIAEIKTLFPNLKETDIISPFNDWISNYNDSYKENTLSYFKIISNQNHKEIYEKFTKNSVNVYLNDFCKFFGIFEKNNWDYYLWEA